MQPGRAVPSALLPESGDGPRELQRGLQSDIQYPMRVRCIRITSETNLDERRAWLTVGQDYVVLSVLADTTGQVVYRLVGDDQRTPALFDASYFEVTSPTLPENWRIRVPVEGGLELAPSAWLVPGFWESYFDGEPEALTSFTAALDTILVS